MNPAVKPPAAAGPPAPVRTVEVRQSLLEGNDRQAARNRRRFQDLGIAALNIVSSPGSGKTTLLERTLSEFGRTVRCAAVVGDLATDRDAQRLGRSGAPVAQITTGSACHLDAGMVSRAVDGLDVAGARILFIENVGNLVCPASFDLGERVRVVLLSAAEGEDKPLKYPPIFKSAHVVILSKMDVAGVLGFDREAAAENVRRIAPQARLIVLSARSGEGMDAWYGLLNSLTGRDEP
jgi:hydrogenase nickel incorporation protein HypB